MQFSQMYTRKTREIWEKVEVKDRQKRIKEREINEIKKREKLMKLKRERDRQRNNIKKDLIPVGMILMIQGVCWTPSRFSPQQIIAPKSASDSKSTNGFKN